jgi:hypothetical protein
MQAKRSFDYHLGDDGLLECGLFNIDKPTLLGRNITFSFTPDTYNPHAILEWQRSMNGVNQWKTIPLNDKFTQHERNMSYYLILTDSVRNNDEVFYRVHYYNETIHCWMDAGKLMLEGMVYQFMSNCNVSDQIVDQTI